VSFLHPSERLILNSMAQLGFYYHHIMAFIDATRHKRSLYINISHPQSGAHADFCHAHILDICGPVPAAVMEANAAGNSKAVHRRDLLVGFLGEFEFLAALTCAR
jgi:hypothetical protein